MGYERAGDYYRVVGNSTNRSVAMFSHGGASGAALSHLFHIPFPQLCGLLHIDFTAVTVVELADRVGELVYPKLLSSDAHHIAGIEIENVYGNGSEHLEITNDKTFIKNGG
ncbi:MAG: histidine phosphatase family protein [Ruminococcaceae bacterium]|nr:histidine phosphatase family protein [Oscillospiraceae bacterium]